MGWVTLSASRVACVCGSMGAASQATYLDVGGDVGRDASSVNQATTGVNTAILHCLRCVSIDVVSMAPRQKLRQIHPLHGGPSLQRRSDWTNVCFPFTMAECGWGIGCKAARSLMINSRYMGSLHNAKSPVSGPRAQDPTIRGKQRFYYVDFSALTLGGWVRWSNGWYCGIGICCRDSESILYNGGRSDMAMRGRSTQTTRT